MTTCRCHPGSFFHDVFISYRRGPDATLVDLLNAKISNDLRIHSNPPRVYVDRQCIRPGADWSAHFAAGLNTSKVILLIISIASLERIRDLNPRQDNVLLEYQKAMLRSAADANIVVIPVFVGTVGQALQPPIAEDFPDVPAVASHPPTSVRAIMRQVLGLHGLFIQPGRNGSWELDEIIDSVQQALHAERNAYRASYDQIPLIFFDSHNNQLYLPHWEGRIVPPQYVATLRTVTALWTDRNHYLREREDGWTYGNQNNGLHKWFRRDKMARKIEGHCGVVVIDI
jgi:hypothetical protein